MLNAGVAGYSSYQGRLRFLQEVGVYEPDLILVSFGWNDLAVTTGKPDKAFTPPPAPWVTVERILLKYQFYLCLRHYVSLLFPAPPPPSRPIHRVSLLDDIRNMEGFLKTAPKHHARVVFLTRPHKPSIDLMRKFPKGLNDVPKYNKALLLFCKTEHAAVIDVREYFHKNHPDLFNDACHFKPEGHRVMADMLYRELSALGYLGKEGEAGDPDGKQH